MSTPPVPCIVGQTSFANLLFAALVQRSIPFEKAQKAWGCVRLTASSPDGGHHARPQYQEGQQDKLGALGMVRNSLV